MIKYALLVATVVVMSQAQRPPYAGSANRQYPQVLPQYLPSVPNDIDSTTEVGQRIGEDAAAAAPSYVPYDPYNDPALIERIKTWPKEHQPFWFLNREAIKNHLAGSGSSTRSASGSTGSIAPAAPTAPTV